MKLKFLASVFFVCLFVFWPLTVANADSNGLKVEVYTYDPVSTPDRAAYTLCESAWISAPNIDSDFDAQYGGVVAGCQADFVLVHYSGYLTSDVSGLITFTDWSDDGFYMSLNDKSVIDAWSLKGCSPASGQAEMVAGVSVVFDAWFYEYGGGACNHLFWDSGIVPASAFSQDVVEPVIVPEPPIVIPTPKPSIPVVVPEPPVVPPVIVPEPPIIVPDPPIVPVTPDKPVSTPDPIPIPETTLKAVVEPSSPDLPIIDFVPPVVLTQAEEHQQLLDNLMQSAQADDIQVPENVANIPVLGASIVVLTDAINFMGNVGADMSSETRAVAKKEVVAAVVVTQIAQFSTNQAVASAQSSASASNGSGSKTKTRRNKE